MQPKSVCWIAGYGSGSRLRPLARRGLGISVAQGSVKGQSFGLIVFFALAELEFSSGNVSPQPGITPIRRGERDWLHQRRR